MGALAIITWEPPGSRLRVGDLVEIEETAGLRRRVRILSSGHTCRVLGDHLVPLPEHACESDARVRALAEEIAALLHDYASPPEALDVATALVADIFPA